MLDSWSATSKMLILRLGSDRFWSFLIVPNRSWSFLTVPDRFWLFLTVPDRFWSFLTPMIMFLIDPDQMMIMAQINDNSNYWHSTKFLLTKFKDNNQRFAKGDTKTKVFINFSYNEISLKNKINFQNALNAISVLKNSYFHALNDPDRSWSILIDPDQSWHQRSGSWSILTDDRSWQ